MQWANRMPNVVTAAAALGVPLVLLVGCASTRTELKSETQPLVEAAMIQPPPEYRILPGDHLDVRFFYNPELNESVVVRPDGKISLQLVDDVPAAGLTPSELDAALTRLYAQELRKPTVSVIVKSFTGQRIYVGGEVGTPGVLTLAPGMTPLQAVINAGGFKETAKLDGTIVIRKGSDSQLMPIRIDLKKALQGPGAVPELRLQAYDIIYVPKTRIAEANRFVRQYVEELLLFRGTTFGFGLTYELNNARR
jgi:polysaccharide biosynthesis/export protein